MTHPPPPAPRWAAAAVGAMVAAFAGFFSVWSLRRHENFFTARFDLGNMTQAVWSAAQGNLLISTDGVGEQVSRLGGHVEPVLFLFGGLWHLWSSPQMLLVVQAAAVATAAIPTYLLARRWVGDLTISLAFAAAALLLPALQWATLFDFHPVTLAAPALLWAIWAAASERNVVLAVSLILAMSTKEQVGLTVCILGVWIAYSLGRRRAGAVVAAAGFVWSAVAIGVVMPHYRSGTAATVVQDRYGALGDSTGDAIRTLVTRPWTAIDLMVGAGQAWYLAALLLPLLGLSLLAPLLAAAALPDLVINLMSSRSEQHAIEYHYSAVIAPILLAAAIRGCGALRAKMTIAPSLVAGALLAAVAVSGYLVGPMPLWRHLPGGSHIRAEQLQANARAATLRDAVRLVPDGVVVSAGNHLGAHLSARRRLLTFPVVADAEWVIVDQRTPDVGDRVDLAAHGAAVNALRARSDMRAIFDRDGVLVLRRVST